MMTEDRWQTLARENLLLHFSKPQVDDLLVLERGEGPYVYDTAGSQYIDALSSLFCAQIGYSYGAEMAEVATPAADHAAVQHQLGHRPPGRDASWPRSCRHWPRPTTTGCTSPAAARSRWSRPGSSSVSTTSPSVSRSGARPSPGRSPTTGSPSGRCRSPASPVQGRLRPAPIEVSHVSNTNTFRAPDGDDPSAFCARLLAEVEQAILDAGPDEVALIIAEPVQNAGGCHHAAARLLGRACGEIADRYGILLMADEVITGFGRIGEWFGSSREGVAPDLISVAKGLTSAYAPMGAVLARSRVVEPLIEAGGGGPARHHLRRPPGERRHRAQEHRDLRAGRGAGERPCAGAAAGVADGASCVHLPIVGDVRGAGFFWAVEMVADADNTRFDQAQRDTLIRGFLPRRFARPG